MGDYKKKKGDDMRSRNEVGRWRNRDPQNDVCLIGIELSLSWKEGPRIGDVEPVTLNGSLAGRTEPI